MGDEKVRSALSILRLVRQETDAIGVAVSFGKDSLATLDLCCRVFRRVEAYYLFRVRGMRIVREWCDQVLDRYGVMVRQYPHFYLSNHYRDAVLQPHWDCLAKVPKLAMLDIETVFRSEAAVEWIAYGWRRSDSRSRALIMKQCAGYDPKSRRVYPIRSWKRGEVYAYLDARGIARPPDLGRKEQSGLDFHPEALAWLRENYPDDYDLWITDFPFSVARVAESEAGTHRRSPADRGQETA